MAEQTSEQLALQTALEKIRQEVLTLKELKFGLGAEARSKTREVEDLDQKIAAKEKELNVLIEEQKKAAKELDSTNKKNIEILANIKEENDNLQEKAIQLNAREEAVIAKEDVMQERETEVAARETVVLKRENNVTTKEENITNFKNSL